MDPLIKGLFKDFRESFELEMMSESDAFELFAATLILPSGLLGQTEISDLLLDPGTLGVDVALLEINGELITSAHDIDAACQNKRSLDVAVHLLQTKSSTSVESAEILNFGNTARMILENRLPPQFSKLRDLSAALHRIFDDYAGKLEDRPSVNLSFVTTASEASLSDRIALDRVEDVKRSIGELGFVGDVKFALYGSKGLYEAARRRNQANRADIILEKSINLPKMPDIDQAILGVVTISELLKLIRDDDGSLDEPVFYDNVRGFKGNDNPVNLQISETLASPERALLPVLNNGVTVVATSYSPKPGDAVTLSGYQIVNGCQTSHCIHLAASEMGADVSDSVYVPLRIVVTENQDIATRIIRATNSQTAVSDSDLLALTNFQKRLEEYYQQDQLSVGLTYERRSGQFYFKAVTRTRIVTISEQMRAVAATFLNLPHLAARYPQHLYEEVGGREVFREEHRLAPYVASAYAAYRLETAFKGSLEADYKPIRYHLLMAYKYHILGGHSAQLNQRSIDSQSMQLVESLKSNDCVNTFRAVATKIVELAGGQMPTRDRLKGARFTHEVVAAFARGA
ncbi:AIPR family protein [Micromonospora sp. NPDC005298]|uniref:AIPR family protein n=1 Tax=Micromonospora sp. NPDC005298 TaxID=3156873 RepID=UPI0033B4A0FC